MADQVEQNNGQRVRHRRQELRRIQNEDARQVTFSKRRKGLFKKASELSTLCGAEVGILINSPAGRPYTFGSPAVDPIFNRFLSDNPDQPNQGLPNPAPFNNECLHQLAMINDLNQQHVNLSSRLDATNFQRALLNDRLKRAADATPECNWSEKIDELQIDELRRLFDILCQTKARLVVRQKETIQAEGASSPHADANIANYPSQQHGLVIGNNSPFVEGSLTTDSHLVQTNQTNVRPPEPRILSSIPPSLSHNPLAGVDLSLASGSVPSSGGARNSLRPPLYGFSFGPFPSNMGNQNPNAGYTSNTDQLFFGPFPSNMGNQNQSYGMSNQPMSYNFNSNIFQPNNPLGGTNYGSTQIDSGSLAGLFGPSSSTPQGQYFWQNLVTGSGSGALNQAGPSNSGINNLLIGPSETNPVDPEEVDPGATSSRQGPM